MSHGECETRLSLGQSEPVAVRRLGRCVLSPPLEQSRCGRGCRRTRPISSLVKGQWTLFSYRHSAFSFVTCVGWWLDVIKESQSRRSHTGRRYRSALRDDPLHRVRDHVLRRLVLDVLRAGDSTTATAPTGSCRSGMKTTTAAWANWPPPHVETFDPFHLPLMNTLILLLSGTTVTWAHHALQTGDRKGARNGLAAHRAARLPLHLRPVWYRVPGSRASRSATKAMSRPRNVYGASFFMATGFHGAHVIIGTIFLAVCLLRPAGGPVHPAEAFRARGRGLVLALR